MYMMRIDPSRSVLLIVCSGRLSTDEALRAVSHAYALAEAGGIDAVSCDLTAVRRGPASAFRVAAAITSLHHGRVRAAMVIGNRGTAKLQRLIDLTGLKVAVRVFEDQEAAGAWLTGTNEPSVPRIGVTEAQHLAGPLSAPFAQKPAQRRPRLRKAGAA